MSDTQGAGYGELVEQVSRLIMTNCVCEKYKGQFDTGHHAECPVPEYSRITSAIQTLTAENFTLAAGQCNVEGGLIGDDHGHFDCSLKARIATLEAKLARAEQDTARLDFLDECNTRLNAKYGTEYGWRLILNHNVNRLMLGPRMDVDLHDSEGGNKKLRSCRAAIDERLRERALTELSEPKP
jgi:hypothetical protein